MWSYGFSEVMRFSANSPPRSVNCRINNVPSIQDPWVLLGHNMLLLLFIYPMSVCVFNIVNTVNFVIF